MSATSLWMLVANRLFVTFAVLGGAFLVNFVIFFLPLWTVALVLLPLMFMVALSIPKTDDGPYGMMNLIFGLFVFIFAIWPHYSAFKISGMPAINPQRVLYGLMVLIWMFSIFYSKSMARLLRDRLATGRVEVLLLAFLLAWQLVTVFSSQEPISSLLIFVRELAVNVLIFFIVISIVRDEKDINKIFHFFAAGALIVALMAVAESFLKHNLFANWLPVTSEYQQWATSERIRGGMYRVQATFDNPLLLVDYLTFAFPIAVFIWLKSDRSLYRLFGLLTTILIAVAMLKTGSRSAIVVLSAEVICLISLFSLRKIKTRKHSLMPYLTLIFLVASIGIATLAVPYLSEIVVGRNANEIGSSTMRMTMVERSMHVIEKQPILGYGINHGAETLGIKMGSQFNYIYILDNYYLTILLESGLPALVLFLALVILFVLRGLRMGIERVNDTGVLSIFLTVSLIGFLIVKIISSQTRVFSLMYLGFALLLVLSKDKETA